jgi:hypothetical protein
MNPLANLIGTYRQIRLIAGLTLIVAPALILVTGYIIEPTIKPTLSHYYFVEPTPGLVRTLFTGFLIFVGGILIAYRGFDRKDNRIHNFAGAFAICVALFPKRCDSTGDPYCAPGLLRSLHAPSAVLLFVFAAWAVIYCGGPKFMSQLQGDEISYLRLAKKGSLIAMLAGVALYVARPFLSAAIQDFKITTLFVELLGFVGFAAHWIVMTLVIGKANRRIRHQRELSRSSEGAIAATVDSKAPQLAQPGVVDLDEVSLLEIP